jgi:alpha-beta hydrolase superfamily lysophospholipase
MSELDYSVFDRPEILQFMFYPRGEYSLPPSGATDHFVEVGGGVSVSCRFYEADRTAPSILFFHGNGEVVADYDWVAAFYTDIGINLFVADYRGYGQSGGRPSFSTMIEDARSVYTYFRNFMISGGYGDKRFVMGRSLGAHSAVEIAVGNRTELRGLILESGFAALARLAGFLAAASGSGIVDEVAAARLARIRSITLPVLIIHGDRDILVTPDQAVEFYENVGSADKRRITICGAGHNDIMHVGMEQYFSEIRSFVFGA